MYLLLKQLKLHDYITITCHTVDQPDQCRLKIGLVTGSNTPDYSNVACQLEMCLPPHDSDELTIHTIVDGESQEIHKESAANNDEGNNISVSFRMRENGLMDIHLGDSNLHSMQLVHEVQNIRFLTVGGDIDKVIGLDFKFEKN